MENLTAEVVKLYKLFRLLNYRKLFGCIREREGSLSATEAFAADVIYLLEKPTITQLADTLGISQPNATYKVGNLVAKGYVVRGVSADDRRECRLFVSEKFHAYYDAGERLIGEAVDKLRSQFSPQEISTFERVLHALNATVQ